MHPHARRHAPHAREQHHDGERAEEGDEEDDGGGELAVHLQLVRLVLLPQNLWCIFNIVCVWMYIIHVVCEL